MSVIRKWDTDNKELQQKCIDEVIARIEELDDGQIGMIAAQDIIDIVTENFGPEIYNKGINDAKKVIDAHMQDVLVDLGALEQ